jgi:uncharacterized protein (TIRG00374 family)
MVVAVILAYIGVLAAFDAQHDIHVRAGDAIGILPVFCVGSFVAFVIRFLRWRWLLQLAGFKTPLRGGFLAYIAGFAFTATPGKVGELVRIRYFRNYGVPAHLVLACFVYERLLDLVVLLVFASLIASTTAAFAAMVIFVSVIAVAVLLLVVSNWPRTRIPEVLSPWAPNFAMSLLTSGLEGLRQMRQFLTPYRLATAVLLGMIGWGLQCLAHAAGLQMLGIRLPGEILFAIPPAAMLVGAASMIPGGVGTTEAAVVLLLTGQGVALERAILAAIALRLGSIWFAVLIGFAAAAWLERGKVADDLRSKCESPGT